MKQFDAIIVGLGAMGSAALDNLAARGARVLGIERFVTPHALGSTHGESRIIRQAYFEGTRYVPLVQRAYELWHELERLSGRQLLRRTGGLFLGQESSDVVHGSIRSAQQYNLPHEILTAREIRDRFPPLAAPDDFIGLYEPVAGALNPEVCVEVLRGLATQRGAQIMDDTEVLGWEEIGDSIEVRTPVERYRTRSLILTPGAWMPSLLNGLDLHLEVRRMTMLWFEPPSGIEPFLPDRFPVYIAETPDYVQFYGMPALGGTEDGVKIAFHNVYRPVVDPNSVERDVSDAEEHAIREIIRRYLPALDGPLRRSVTCLYTMTGDEHFVIDRHPSSQKVILASCCSGHGFKFSPAIGEALAALALDENQPVNISDFRRR